MLKIINSIIWSIALVFIMYSSLLLTKKLKFKQFKTFKTIKIIFKNSLAFKSLMMSLGSRIGVGSIAGVSLAIFLGGKGTIFWMWISAILGSIITYSETYLAIKYKNEIGGPFMYIKNGLNNKKLAYIYAFIIIISYLFGFASIQSNTITKSFNEITNLPLYIIGILLTILVALVIFKKLNIIVNIVSKIVPIILIIYIFITIIIIFKNFSIIPDILLSIIKDAFKLKPFLSGFISTLIIGVQRGIFSSEAGVGTCSISSSTIGYDDIKSNASIQILSVYITTLFICTITSLVILTSNIDISNLNNINGIEIIQKSFEYHLNNFGDYFILIIIFLFSFSTILTGYYDSEISYKYITKKSLKILKISTVLSVFIGSISSSIVIWNIVDILVAILSIINIYAIFKLKNEIKI